MASDSSGAATWQALAESFGQTWVNSTSRTEVNIRLPGQYWDAESGRHYNLQRYYDPQTGRYLQSDPLGLYDGINTYGYAYQNPLSYSDPTGEAVPAIVWSYARCVASCKAADALMAAIQSECDPRTLGDCALECLNPLDWLGSKHLKINKKTPAVAKDKWIREPASLQDQMTLEAAKRGAGQKIIESLNDPAFKGMEKWEYKVKSAEGLDSVVHYVRDPKTGKLYEFKFKKRSIDSIGNYRKNRDGGIR
ncbi:RHS repeat domain-containing protein [Vandammella animalimorsus]|uniref:RHS repeat domain-containing protein n=1 Tax=Vandammella animalimorsus TaxID=2029117 RepID=UPI0023AEDCC6|nr:RHS repeat-associated core domain-containing protein [Vandammella animalimorsus]